VAEAARRAASLERLFAPRAVAVVGASSDARKVAGRPARFMAARGYAGEVYGVNPSVENTGTRLAVASIDALPDGIDVAILCIPVDRIVDAVAACGRRRIPFAVIFANGFADTGNHALQAQLVAVAAERGVRLLGPNCLGVFDLSTNFTGTFASRLDTRRLFHGCVGVVSQSGAVGNAALLSFEALELGVSAWLATGNEADIDALEGIACLLERDDTEVIVTMLEAVRAAGAQLQELGRVSRARGKPIIVLKSGRSDASKAAAQSHAGKIVGSFDTWTQVIRDCGWLQVESIEHLTDVALAMGKGGWRQVGSVAVLCGSGGMGGLFCDDLTQAGIPLAILAPETLARLGEVLPAGAGLGNPVDPTTVSEDVYYQAAELLVRDAAVSTVILLINSLARNYDVAEARLGLLVQTAKANHTRLAISYFSPHDVLPAAVEKALMALGVLILPTGPRLASALGTIDRWDRFGKPDARPVMRTDEGVAPSSHAVPQSLIHLAGMLAQYGIDTVPTLTVNSDAEALAVLHGGQGRIVLKLEGTDIAHKTEQGLVHTGLSDAVQVSVVMARLRHLQATHGGVIVAQPQLEDRLEVLVAGLTDPELGRLITVGLGGVFVELLHEAVVAPVPLDEPAAQRLLAQGRLADMLAGYRGAPARDVPALARLLVACSRLLAEHPEMVEFELNPVMVGPLGAGASAVDALAVMAPA